MSVWQWYGSGGWCGDVVVVVVVRIKTDATV
jgi:hypothetical protein